MIALFLHQGFIVSRHTSTAFCVFLFLSGLLLSSSPVWAKSNLRIGGGMVMLDTKPAVGSLKNGQSRAFVLFAEMPESQHTSSRFMLYTKKQTEQERYWGLESQFFFGWGLDRPGLRLYTGPAWHYEKHRFNKGGATKTMYGWGWNTGIGLQAGPIQIDLAGNYRDPSDYPKIKNKRPTVWFIQVLAGYRF